MVGYIRIILEEKGVHVSIWICLFYLDIRDCVISCHVFSSNSHFAWTMIVIRQNINWLLLLLLTPIGKLRSRWRNGYRGSLENHPITKRRRRWLNISKRVTISFNHGRPFFFFFFSIRTYDIVISFTALGDPDHWWRSLFWKRPDSPKWDEPIPLIGTSVPFDIAKIYSFVHSFRIMNNM